MQYIPTRLEQKRGMKSSVVIGSSIIFNDARIRLKTFPISFTPRLLTSQISLKVLGSFSCLSNKDIPLRKFESTVKYFLPTGRLCVGKWLHQHQSSVL